MNVMKKLIELVKKNSVPFTYNGQTAFVINDNLAIVPETEKFIAMMTVPCTDGEREWCEIELQENTLDDLLKYFEKDKNDSRLKESNNNQQLYQALRTAKIMGIVAEPLEEGIFIFENGMCYDFPINRWVYGTSHQWGDLSPKDQDELTLTLNNLITHKRHMTMLLSEAAQFHPDTDFFQRTLICKGDGGYEWNKPLFELVMDNAGSMKKEKAKFFEDLSVVLPHNDDLTLAKHTAENLLPARAFKELDKLLNLSSWRYFVKYAN